MTKQRIIGRYRGKERGPLLIIFGGMHGNEPSGVKALELVFKMIEVEPITNLDFNFKGKIIGLRGNVRALAKQKRFINRDLNRQWTVENINKIKKSDYEDLDEEEREIRENLFIIEREIEDYNPDKIVVLDLHTTTAYGGIFGIATNDPESLRIAVELHAPVILGLLDSIKGTSLHYFSKENFKRDITSVCFEGGQHDEPLSVNRAIAAIINCFRIIGCVRAEDVENRHDSLLQEYSKNLPAVSRLVGVHSIKEGDNFVMKPGYSNFQKVKKDEILAEDCSGEIKAPKDALVLMPLYQKQGEDGFFLIEKVDY
ncbi:MAG: succinylglutamate desuccinylase [Saprospiraceae bacterium]|jgi:succinylglutamate desuccinylase